MRARAQCSRRLSNYLNDDFAVSNTRKHTTLRFDARFQRSAVDTMPSQKPLSGHTTIAMTDRRRRRLVLLLFAFADGRRELTSIYFAADYQLVAYFHTMRAGLLACLFVVTRI